MSKINTAVSTTVNEDIAAQLSDGFPQDQSGLRIQLPRLSMASQDVTEETGKGKLKKIEVITAAGTFFTEAQSEEEEEVEDKEGNIVKKKVWKKDEIGEEIEATVFFQRKQLKMYDEATGAFTSSPIYDTEDEVLPLFCDKAEVARGTPADLKAKYLFVDEKTGKQKSKLEDNRVLYVLYNGEIYQMNLRGSSMYSFMTYSKKAQVPIVLTKIGSESKEKGSIKWNQMTFTTVRGLDNKEATEVLSHQQRIKSAVVIEKASYASTKAISDKADKELDEMVAGASKKF